MKIYFSLPSGLLQPVRILFLSFCSTGLFFSSLAQPSVSDTSTLFQVIRSGDEAKLEAFLNAHPMANAVMQDYSALMAASLNGSGAEMQILIKHGADVNFANHDGVSALWLAVPDREKTMLLVSNGANVQQKSREGYSVLVKLASIPGSVELMQYLVSKGGDLRKSGAHNDLMYNAASSNDTAIVGYLMRAGLSVNDTTTGGDYPIIAATLYRGFEVLKMLIDNGANPNVSPKHAILPLISGVTPLMWAAVSNEKSSFYYLLEHGADPKTISPIGYTSLMYLAMADEDDPEMTMALITRGVQPDAIAKDNTSALYFARLKGNTQSVTILEKYLHHR